jgi:hypothetical protein
MKNTKENFTHSEAKIGAEVDLLNNSNKKKKSLMTTVSGLNQGINSVLSLHPLILVLKRMIADGKSGAKKLYQGLLTEIEQVPELMQPITDQQILADYGELVETLLTTIFPPSTRSTQGVYSVTLPFQSETIYSSPAFAQLFLKDGIKEIQLPDNKTSIDIGKANLSLAYNVILKNLYGQPVPITTSSAHPFFDETTGLTTYYELNLNAQFVDVKCLDENFALPNGYSPDRPIEIEELTELFPLELFRFEGLIVIDVFDITHEQVIAEIKNSLLNINAFSDTEVYSDLQQHVQDLMGITRLQIGITPFFKMNDYYLYTETHYQNSLLFKNKLAIKNRDRISSLARSIFKNSKDCILYEILNESSSRFNELLKYYYDQGLKSLVLCPLKCENGELIGLLEIAGETKGKLQYPHLNKIKPAIPLFTLALEKTNESMQMQIEKTIKEHFTAIQPAVEWKFTEAAFQFLQNTQFSELARMPSISFEDVYPLYGAIDVRNSSTERSKSIQLDLLEQLEMVKVILVKAVKVMEFPLLKEILFRIEKYMESTSDALLSEDEMLIYEFLQYDIDLLFKNLRQQKPELRKSIDHYFGALDPQRKILFNKRKQYEESITRINDVLDRFMDNEQQAAQEVFPHYFERYVTDGIEFNIYVGQAISPQHQFNEIYVRNLKLWQLTLLAKAARITDSLEKKLSLPLKTTQLILAHSVPLNISFRRKERKFDVDGAYNIRYEIVKKRIDKVHIKDTDERLTQPGTIGIVYSQQKELVEYLEYIEFLQKEGMLGEQIEHLDLEDTQGINGLKALRVDVLLTEQNQQQATGQEEKSVALTK